MTTFDVVEFDRPTPSQIIMLMVFREALPNALLNFSDSENTFGI